MKRLQLEMTGRTASTSILIPNQEETMRVKQLNYTDDNISFLERQSKKEKVSQAAIARRALDNEEKRIKRISKGDRLVAMNNQTKIVNVDELLRSALVGKKLVGLEFGANEEGNRTVEFGKEITHVEMYQNGEDAVLWIKCGDDDDGEIYAYANESITVE